MVPSSHSRSGSLAACQASFWLGHASSIPPRSSIISSFTTSPSNLSPSFFVKICSFRNCMSGVCASLFSRLRFSTSIITRSKFNASAVDLSTCQSSKLYDLASAYDPEHTPTRLMRLPRRNGWATSDTETSRFVHITTVNPSASCRSATRIA